MSLADFNEIEQENCQLKYNFEPVSGIPMKPLKIFRWGHFGLALERAVKIG